MDRNEALVKKPSKYLNKRQGSKILEQNVVLRTFSLKNSYYELLSLNFLLKLLPRNFSSLRSSVFPQTKFNYTIILDNYSLNYSSMLWIPFALIFVIEIKFKKIPFPVSFQKHLSTQQRAPISNSVYETWKTNKIYLGQQTVKLLLNHKHSFIARKLKLWVFINERKWLMILNTIFPFILDSREFLMNDRKKL